MDESLRQRQREEHRARYQGLAETLGWDTLRTMVAPLLERCKRALAEGDEHLNSISLATWDRLALGPVEPTGACPTCGQRRPNPTRTADWPASQLRRTARMDPWRNAPSLSLAGRVCALKHVAREEALRDD